MVEEGLNFSEYFVNTYLKGLELNPWIVNFSQDSELPDQEVKLDVRNQLVIGFGAKKLNSKMNYISTDDIEETWNEMMMRYYGSRQHICFHLSFPFCIQYYILSATKSSSSISNPNLLCTFKISLHEAI